MHPLAVFQTGKICYQRQLDCCLMSYCTNVELWELVDTEVLSDKLPPERHSFQVTFWCPEVFSLCLFL